MSSINSKNPLNNPFKNTTILNEMKRKLSGMPTESDVDVLNFAGTILEQFELVTNRNDWSPEMNTLFKNAYINYTLKPHWTHGGSASRTKKNRMIYLRKNNSRSRVYLTRNASSKFKRTKYSIKNKIASGGGMPKDLKAIVYSTIGAIKQRVHTDTACLNECNADKTKCKTNNVYVEKLRSIIRPVVIATNTALTQSGVFGQQVTSYMSHISTSHGSGVMTLGKIILMGIPMGLSVAIGGCIAVASACIVHLLIVVESKSARKELDNACTLNHYITINSLTSIFNVNWKYYLKNFMTWLTEKNELYLFVPSSLKINKSDLNKYKFIMLIHQKENCAALTYKDESSTDLTVNPQPAALTHLLDGDKNINDVYGEVGLTSVNGKNDDGDEYIKTPTIVPPSFIDVQLGNDIERRDCSVVDLNKPILVKIGARSSVPQDIVTYDYFDFATFHQTPTNKPTNIKSYAKCIERTMSRIFGNKNYDLTLNYMFIENDTGPILRRLQSKA
jgi:hypothetical protein